MGHTIKRTRTESIWVLTQQGGDQPTGNARIQCTVRGLSGRATEPYATVEISILDIPGETFYEERMVSLDLTYGRPTLRGGRYIRPKVTSAVASTRTGDDAQVATGIMAAVEMWASVRASEALRVLRAKAARKAAAL